MHMRYAFILNPAARNGRAGKRKAEIEQELRSLGVEYAILETEHRHHATELARDASQTYDVVVAVGGDGTVQEVAQALLGSRAQMGILPLGTGNDFAQATGMPERIEEAISLLVSTKSTMVDVGKVEWQEEESEETNQRVFTNCVGAGFDAMVAIVTPKYKFLGGNLAYVAGVIETLGKWRQSSVEIRVQVSDEESSEPLHHIHSGRFFLIEIDNGFSVGGGFLLTPEAEINDGLLDVCLVDQISVPRVLQVMPKTFSGKHVNEPEVTMCRSKKITIEATESLPVQADGEILSTTAIAMTVEVLPNALKIIAPSLHKASETV